jgi:23S rRNA (cytidine1920-2'-O)/16S rRNA (cytidine1409-2'-O)-methyltransferase
LDVELVRRGLARSREHASVLIADGKVLVQGMRAKKPATGVETSVAIVVRDDDDPNWASRGAYKLLGALECFGAQGFSVVAKRCLDAGASTGGFTDVLLRHQAEHVIAADVGRGLLDWRLRTDDRVTVMDKTNVRNLTPQQLGGQVEVIVGDLSFISLRLVLPALTACLAAGGDLVPMVKPQFEVGKERLGSGGVVRDPELRVSAVVDVLREASKSGLEVRGVTASPLPGPSGNVEYFVWLRKTDEHSSEVATGASESIVDTDPIDLVELVRDAVAKGPQ